MVDKVFNLYGLGRLPAGQAHKELVNIVNVQAAGLRAVGSRGRPVNKAMWLAKMRLLCFLDQQEKYLLKSITTNRYNFRVGVNDFRKLVINIAFVTDGEYITQVTPSLVVNIDPHLFKTSWGASPVYSESNHAL